MKLLLTLVSIAIFMTGCAPGNNTPGTTVVGATVGGLAGGVLTHGAPAGIVIGAMLGGIGGYAIGNQMDQNDRQYLEQQVWDIPDNRTIVYTSSRGEVYRVTPSIRYYHADAYCRDYTMRTFVNGRVVTTYGRACHQPTHTWIIQGN